MADRKIDVHAHFITPVYREVLLEHGYSKPDGMPGIPEWSTEAHLAYMDSAGIGKSILSISSPGPDLSLSAPRNATIARETNEYAAQVKQSNSSRFGFFASLSLLDPLSAVVEVGYALDKLHADGFVLMSNCFGTYLGDPALRPVLAELNQRSAVVLVHPTAPCSRHVADDIHIHRAGAKGEHHMPHLIHSEHYPRSSPLAHVYPAPMFEYFFDTSRSFLDLLLSGTVLRFPRIRWVVPHCGGTLSALIDRVAMYFAQSRPLCVGRDALEISEEQLRKAIREKFWFDLAGKPLPNLVPAMLQFTSPERLLFGSDVPWTPFRIARDFVEQLQKDLPRCVTEERLQDIYSGNAESLLGL